eukprot:1102601-Pelagomonas_calceolata.AAC.2
MQHACLLARWSCLRKIRCGCEFIDFQVFLSPFPCVDAHAPYLLSNVHRRPLNGSNSGKTTSLASLAAKEEAFSVRQTLDGRCDLAYLCCCDPMIAHPSGRPLLPSMPCASFREHKQSLQTGWCAFCLGLGIAPASMRVRLL